MAAAVCCRLVQVGGMWVECDTNLPSGESLVRQLLMVRADTRTHDTRTIQALATAPSEAEQFQA